MVKIRHRVPPQPYDYIPPSHVETDERYLAELESARKKAEKAWRNAQKALAAAEERAEEKPTVATRQARATALERFEAREAELAAIERLMQPSTGGTQRAVHRAGKDDRLEVGKSRKRRRR